MNKLALAFVLACVLVAPGCVAAEDRDLISTMAAVGHGNLREWDTLTPEQRKEAHFNMVSAAHVLDLNINGRALPPEYAPVTSAAEGQ
jgi:hypothetical protein